MKKVAVTLLALTLILGMSSCFQSEEEIAEEKENEMIEDEYAYDKGYKEGYEDATEDVNNDLVEYYIEIDDDVVSNIKTLCQSTELESDIFYDNVNDIIKSGVSISIDTDREGIVDYKYLK